MSVFGMGLGCGHAGEGEGEGKGFDAALVGVGGQFGEGEGV